jgi:methyl-accepting chemotaxis protein
VRESESHVSEIARLMDEQSGATTELAQSVSGIAEGARRARERTDHVVSASAGSEAAVVEGLANLADRNIDHFVLHCAKSDHLLWKKRLAGMLVGRF